METLLQIKLLRALKKAGKPFEITVTGVSMNLTLRHNDIVKISPENAYDIGDILVFEYNAEEVLIHRLIEIKDNIYYCKGDNSIKMEEIPFEQIIGKVSEIQRNSEVIEIPPCTDKLIMMAKAVNNLFVELGYNEAKTSASYIYKIYQKIFIDGENIKMYIKNERMDFIEVEESLAAVFDPTSGDTHFLDEAGIDIMKILEQPHDFDVLVNKICKIYDGEHGEIASDVREFLSNAVEKRIVLEL